METIYDYPALPKKRLAAGVLLLDEQGHVLIVNGVNPFCRTQGKSTSGDG